MFFDSQTTIPQHLPHGHIFYQMPSWNQLPSYQVIQSIQTQWMVGPHRSIDFDRKGLRDEAETFCFVFSISKFTAFAMGFSENRVAMGGLQCLGSSVLPCFFHWIWTHWGCQYPIAKHTEDLSSLRLSFNQAAAREFRWPRAVGYQDAEFDPAWMGHFDATF